MSPKNYIIVGAEVGQERFHLEGDDKFVTQATATSTPLNVEFIGKLMVKLSGLGPEGLTAAERKKHENAVLHALQVREGPGIGGAVLSPSQIDEIFRNTTVDIVFETRRAMDGVEVNNRILVVPADGTLGKKAEELSLEPEEAGFEPPLAYEIDGMLMVAAKAKLMMNAVQSFGDLGLPGWTQTLQDALEAHVTARLEELSTFLGDAGAKSVILEQPLRAFHRSVGIYATNMCR